MKLIRRIVAAYRSLRALPADLSETAADFRECNRIVAKWEQEAGRGRR